MSELEHDLAERRIREAMAAGAFDDLPGAGRPLDLRGAGDPDWWIRRKLESEQLDAAAMAPGALGLRRERERMPESLLEHGDEHVVRELLEDYNRRVKEDRLRPAPGLPSSIVAPLVDIEAMAAAWRERRARR